MFKNLSPKALGVSASQGELIELALSFGFRGIDLDVVQFAEQVRDQGLPKARRLLDSAKLRIGTFALPFELDADDEAWKQGLDKLPELASLARELGGKRCQTTIAPASDTRPYHQNFEFHRQRLTEVAGKLEPAGVHLAVGFEAWAHEREGKAFEFIHDLDALLVLLGTVTARNVGLAIDLWQVWAASSSLEAVRGRLKPGQIVTVAVADVEPGDCAAPDECPPTSRRLPGETGIIHAAEALATLSSLGYDGPVTPCPDSSRFAGMRRDQIVKLCGQKLDEVWKAAGLKSAGAGIGARR
ncbi:MAG: TIM barrel protein [Pirellulales bacterium]